MSVFQKVHRTGICRKGRDKLKCIPLFFLNLVFILYWGIVDLQSCMSFRCTAKQFSYMHTSSVILQINKHISIYMFYVHSYRVLNLKLTEKLTSAVQPQAFQFIEFSSYCKVQIVVSESHTCLVLFPHILIFHSFPSLILYLEGISPS